MPMVAIDLLVAVCVDTYKASSRYLNRRKSRKHGYSSLRTDSLGRPISEDGKRLSKNQAKALVEHHKELKRILTAENEWRAKGERLPAYGEMNDDAILQSLRRPSTAPAREMSSSSSSMPSSSRTSTDNSAVPNTGVPRRPRTRSTAVRLDSIGIREQRDARTDDLAALSFEAGVDGRGAFSVRRQTETMVLLTIPSTNETPEIEDIFQHDGLDWRRATWEGPPIYQVATQMAAATAA